MSKDLSQLSISALINSGSSKDLSQLSISALINSGSSKDLSQLSISVLYNLEPIYLFGSTTGSGDLTGSLINTKYFSGSTTGSVDLSGDLEISIYKNIIYSTAI